MQINYFRLLLIGIPIIFTFITLEIFLRISGIGSPNIFITKNGIPFKKANSTLVNKKENYNLAKFNNFGFHDFDRENNNSKYRIALIGDSFVEGLQVPRDSLFSTILNEKIYHKDNLEFIPFGISGTGTAYHYKLWKDFIRNEIRIDHIILVFFLDNDLSDNHEKLVSIPYGDALYLNADGEIYKNSVKTSYVKELISFTRQYSAIINLTYERLHILNRSFKKKSSNGLVDQTNNTREEKYNLINEKEKYWEESITGTINLISDWEKELRKEKTEFSLILFNKKINNKTEKLFVKKISEISNYSSIKFKNIIFPEYSDKFFFNYKNSLGHFNYRGHKYFSLQISKFFNDNYPIAFSRKVK